MTTCMGNSIAVHLAVAGDVSDGVLFLLSFFPRDVLNEIWNSIDAVSEDFSYLFLIAKTCQLELNHCILKKSLCDCCENFIEAVDK